MDQEVFEELEEELLSNGYEKAGEYRYSASDKETGILLDEAGISILDAEGAPLNTKFELSLDGIDDALWCVKRARQQNLPMHSDFFENTCKGRRSAL
ncbi:MAG: hypothetical protein JRL30_29900 [Deltaproteobacteria bacterium]|nr:hypothetical protein [Deltaproteobacteria bacterium]